jgi:hypothetical protein
MTVGYSAPLAAFAVGKKFTMTYGPSGYNNYLYTVTAVGTAGSSVTATATQAGSPVIFAPGTINTPGEITPLSPTTFQIPNTQARTVRGVGTAFISVALGQLGGGDDTEVTIAADNLPQHRHGVLVPGNGMLSGGSAGGYPNVDNGTSTIAGTTRLEDGSTPVTNSPLPVTITNTFLGLNYIIKT